jgi:hypothetical protein
MGSRTGTSNPKRVTLLALALKTWISGPGFQDLGFSTWTHARTPLLLLLLSVDNSQPHSVARSFSLSLARSGPRAQDLGFRTWILGCGFRHRTAHRDIVQFCHGTSVCPTAKRHRTNGQTSDFIYMIVGTRCIMHPVDPPPGTSCPSSEKKMKTHVPLPFQE